MSDAEKLPAREASGDGLRPDTPVPVVLELHEAMALALLYDEAPADLNLERDGQWWGGSLDRAMLRIADAMARTLGDKELLKRGGVLWAYFDQLDAGP